MGRVRTRRDAASSRHQQDRPSPRQLRSCAHGVSGSLRKRGAAALPPRARRRRDQRLAGAAVRQRVGLQRRRGAGHDPAGGCERTRRSRCRPRHAHRGDHRRERGRDADGPLPRWGGRRPRHPDQRSGDRRCARFVLSGVADLRPDRGRNRGIARGDDTRVPLTARARGASRDRSGRQAGEAPHLRPGRSVGRRGGEHGDRLLPGAGLPAACILRHRARELDSAHRRTRLGRPRPSGPRQ